MTAFLDSASEWVVIGIAVAGWLFIVAAIIEWRRGR